MDSGLRSPTLLAMAFGRDFLAFLACHKKWWLTPIVASLAWLAVLLVTAGGAGTSTFQYTMF